MQNLYKNKKLIVDKRKFLKISALFTFLSFLFIPQYSYPLPQEADIVSGEAEVSAADNTMKVKVTTDKMIANWQSFSIAQSEAVHFYQPSSSSVALNRVVGANPSSILGTLTATGKLFLINPNGILFGPNSYVDTAGLVASTLNISDEDFLAGRYTFYGQGGSVVNQGYISAPGGYVALLGSSVENSGVIEASLGSVALASGEALTLNLDPQGLISVVVDEATSQNLKGKDSAVKNTGSICTEGGKVILTAKALDGVFDKAVNNEGIIEAESLVNKNGEVYLIAEGEDSVASNTGTIDVSAKESGADGGFVEISGVNLDVTKGAIDTSSLEGDAGTILFDPPNFSIDDAWETLFETQDDTNIIVQADNNVTFNLTDNLLDLINFDTETFKIEAGNNINLNDDGIKTYGGKIELFADFDDKGPGNLNLGKGLGLNSNGGNIRLQGANINLTSLVDAGTGNVSLTASGAINDNADSEATDIIGNQLDMSAANGIGSGNALETEVSNLSASSDNGNIEIVNKSNDNINVNRLSTTNGNIVFSNEGVGSTYIYNVYIDNSGGQRGLFTITTNGYTYIDYDNNAYSIEAYNTNVEITNQSAEDTYLWYVYADNSASTEKGKLELTTNGYTEIYDVELYNSDITVENKGVDEDTYIYDVYIDNSEGQRGLLAITTNGYTDIELYGNDYSIEAYNTNVEITNQSAEETYLENLSTSKGNIILTSDSFSIEGSIVTDTGDIFIKNYTDDKTFGLGDDISGQDIVLDSDAISYLSTKGLITIGSSTAGSISIGSADFGDKNVALISKSTISSEGGFITANTLRLNAGSNIVLETNVNYLYAQAAGHIDIKDTGSLTLQDVQSSSTQKYVGITTSGDMYVKYIYDPSSVTLTSSNGAIIDDNGDSLNIQTNPGGELILSAKTGIGSGNPLETQVSNLQADNTVSGNIEIDNYGDLFAQSVINKGGDVYLTTYSDLTLGYIEAIGNFVDLNAVNGSILNGSGSSLNILADTAELNASSNIGSATSPINTNLDILTGLSSGTGDIYINEADSIGLGNVDTTTGTGCSLAANDGIIHVTSAGDITVNSVIAPRGGVFLETTDGSIYAGEGWSPVISTKGSYTMDLSGTDWQTLGSINYFSQQMNAPLSAGPNVISGGASYFSAPSGTIGIGNVGNPENLDNPLRVCIQVIEGSHSALPSGYSPEMVSTPYGLRPVGLTLNIGGATASTIDAGNGNGPLGASGMIEGIVRPGVTATAGVNPSPAIDNTSATPLNPSGYVFYNDTDSNCCSPLYGANPANKGSLQIWPEPLSDTLSENGIYHLMSVLNKISPVYYRILSFSQFLSFEPVTPVGVYAYHPITETDFSAFDEITLDVEAYEFIQNNINLKKSLAPYFGTEKEGKKREDNL